MIRRRWRNGPVDPLNGLVQDETRPCRTLATVSHNLHTPLQAIDGYIKAILDEHSNGFDAEARHRLDQVRAAAQQTGMLIDGLLNLSRVARPPLSRQCVDLTALARKVFAELAEAEPERHVEIHVSEVLVANADPDLLTVVLENLLGSAWKFTRQQPQANIEVG